MSDALWINDRLAEAKGGLTLDRGATFTLDRPLRIPTLDTRFTFDLNGAQLRATTIVTKAGMLIHAKLGAELELINGHLIGTKDPAQPYEPAVEDHHGVALYGCRDFTIDGLTIEHVAGDFIYLAAGPGPRGPKAPLPPNCSGWIDGVEADDAGRHAIAALAVDWLRLGTNMPCTFTNWRRRRINRERAGRFHTPASAIVEAPGNVWAPYRKPPKPRRR